MTLSLKNGSGIHIKKKNRGSFTKWCGGNVTNECILKGKNSSNPKIRRKATFADNARHFKHQEGGVIHKAPMLDRLHHNNLFTSLQFIKDEDKLKRIHNSDYYFDAGSFPEVTIKPDGFTATKIQTMIPDKTMRNNWYKIVNNRLSYHPETSLRGYADRVYNVWDSVGRPSVKSSYGGLHNTVFDLFAGKGREHNMFGSIYLKPESPSLESELSHSFKDTFYIPGSSILPADVKINGKDGYSRPGHPEYVTHNIIQPLLQRYYFGGDSGVDSIPKVVESALSRYYVPKFYGLPSNKIKINKKLYGGTVSDDIINQSNIVSPFITYTDNANDYLKLKQQKEQLDINRELLKLNRLYSFFNNMSEYLSGILGNILLKKVDSTQNNNLDSNTSKGNSMFKTNFTPESTTLLMFERNLFTPNYSKLWGTLSNQHN